MNRFDSLDKTGVVGQNNNKNVPTIAKRFNCSNVKSVFRARCTVLGENQGCEVVSS